MTGLTALNPFFLSLLPLAVLPIIFHLFFRLKKQARSFPTLMFFHRIDPKLNARRRLREWLILLLRTLLILFLLLALARPIWFGVGRQGAVAVALVLDNSGSMSGAGEGGQTKLKQAVNAARSVVLQLRAKDSAGIVLLVDDPTVPLPAGLSSDKAALRNALEHISETEAGGSVARAFERAVALFDGSPATHFEIHVLSDLQAEKWNQAPVDLRAPRRGTSVVVHRIPSPRANQANVSLAGAQVAAKSILAGRRLPLEARLLNPTAVEGHVRLNWLDDAGHHGSQEIALLPQADTTTRLTLDVQDPGFRWVNLWLEGDEFTADNRAPVAFVCSEKKAVLFIGKAAEFGQLPLAISPGSEGRLSGLIPAFVDVSAVANYLRDNPPGLAVLTWEALTQTGPDAAVRWAALKSFLDRGGSVLLVPSTVPGNFGARPEWLAVAPDSLQSAASGLALTVLDKTHPMFNDLRDEKGEVALRNVRVLKFYPLRSPPTNTPVLGLEDGRALLVEQKIGRGRLLAGGLAFASSWSTLPLKPGFVALAQNLAPAPTGATTNLISLVAGEPLRLGAPETASIQVQSLAGSPLDWKGEPAQLPTLPRAGVYAVRDGGETTYVAVRSSEKEGRQKFLASHTLPALGKISYVVKEFTGGEALVSTFRRLEKSLDLSLPLLLLALACLALEGWLANPLPIKPSQTKSTPAPALADSLTH